MLWLGPFITAVNILLQTKTDTATEIIVLTNLNLDPILLKSREPLIIYFN